MTRHALIFGIHGQDGFYLQRHLLGLGYRVSGFARPDSNRGGQDTQGITLFEGDITDAAAVRHAIATTQPDEIYNLASQSSPALSWQCTQLTAQVNGFAAQLIFDLARELVPEARIFHASSSDMYGEAVAAPQDEHTPFQPNNPYSIAKYYAHRIAGLYRRHFGQFIACGIMFNHESPRRPLQFVPQKIAYAAACLSLGITDSPACDEQGAPVVKGGKLRLGNLDARRDWGNAEDYVIAMHAMLQHDMPEDFVIGSGQLHSVRELCACAFSHVGLDWQDYVTVDENLFRRTETSATVANAQKAAQLLGWTPRTAFSDMIGHMVDCHLRHMAEDTVE